MDAARIVEMFEAFGPVVPRRMFSGFGVFADGTMFALVVRDTLYLKADQQTVAAFEAEGLGPFSYMAKGRKRASMSYWRAPDRLYDDPDELAGWARDALAAAHRSGRGKAKRKTPSVAVRRPRSRPRA